ncbi:MAG: Gfo/Idh/MocA family protein [Ginsengibacter sp.]
MQRRQFIKNSAIAGVGVGLTGLQFSSFAQKNSADKVRLAVLGTNGRGLAHIEAYHTIPNVEIAYICDVEEKALAKGMNLAEKLYGKRPKAIKDFRTILDDKDIHAVSIATPDHWHTPAAILALSTGKQVYVEKPCGHNPEEGEMLVAAQKKYRHLVQMGNQRRSWPNINEAMKLIHDGIIGEVYYGKGWYANNRGPIGHGKVVAVPSNLDWQLWQGPAPREDYRDNLVHYNWHWFWNWGTGESCNNGTHEIDCMRWALGVNYPSKVVSGGGRYVYDDDWQAFDTQMITFEFPEKKAISWEGRSCNNYPEAGGGRGFKIYGKNGTLVNSGNDDYKIFDKDNKLIRESKKEEQSDVINTMGPGVQLDAYHFKNFIDAVRDGKPLNSPITEGHKSVLLCHLGNIAQRVGRKLHCDPSKGGKILDDKEAQALWSREYESGWRPDIQIG